MYLCDEKTKSILSSGKSDDYKKTIWAKRKNPTLQKCKIGENEIEMIN